MLILASNSPRRSKLLKEAGLDFIVEPSHLDEVVDEKLKPQEMDGSTFTISNLGMFGIQEFTSIINQPNGAILSVGAIMQKPVVKAGVVVVGNTMKLTLACDHRVVDGATGAQFLQTLREYVENPLTMVL